MVARLTLWLFLLVHSSYSFDFFFAIVSLYLAVMVFHNIYKYIFIGFELCFFISVFLYLFVFVL